MSTARARARRGNAPLRTATQLGEVLTEPLYWMLLDKVRPAFPLSTRAAPSYFVRLMDTGAGLFIGGPVDIHRDQWVSVVVPVFSDSRTQTWLGSFHTGSSSMGGFDQVGAPVTLPNTVYGPDGDVATAPLMVGGISTETPLTKGTVVGRTAISNQHLNPLYKDDPEGFKRFLKALIVQTAKTAGYGS